MHILLFIFLFYIYPVNNSQESCFVSNKSIDNNVAIESSSFNFVIGGPPASHFEEVDNYSDDFSTLDLGTHKVDLNLVSDIVKTVSYVSLSKSNNDSDNDGYDDDKDNCPETSNPDQKDSDSDGVGDVCDNCVNIYNPDQSDNNNDGIGNVCDQNDGFYDNIKILSDTYTKFNNDLRQVYLIETEYSVLNIDKNDENTTSKDKIDLNLLSDLETIDKIMKRVDDLYSFYKATLGFEPNGGNSKYSNKVNVYFGKPSCGSGCGLVGSKGIEVSQFENIFFNLKYNTNVNGDVIIAYEFGRNFFVGDINKIMLPFQPNSDEKNGGFSEAFANIMYIDAFDQILTEKTQRELNETLMNKKWQ